MNRSIIMSLLIATLGLVACDKPVVVNVPEDKVVVPGPAGPAGQTGEQGTQGVSGNKGDIGVKGNTGDAGVQGNEGSKGETGKSGESTTVIITPPAAPEPAPTN